MEEKRMISFRIKIFDRFGAVVEEFTVSEATKIDADQYVRSLMRVNKMDTDCTFEIS